MIAATVPYGLAMKLVASLCGIEVSVKGVEQMVERRAERALVLDEQQAQGCRPFDDKGLPVAEQLRPQDAVEPSAAPQVAYVELDGVVPVTRQELGDEEPTEQDKQRREQANGRTCNAQESSRARRGRWCKPCGSCIPAAPRHKRSCRSSSAISRTTLTACTTLTSSSSAWRPRLPAAGCHLRISVRPRACGA